MGLLQSPSLPVVVISSLYKLRVPTRPCGMSMLGPTCRERLLVRTFRVPQFMPDRSALRNKRQILVLLCCSLCFDLLHPHFGAQFFLQRIKVKRIDIYRYYSEYTLNSLSSMAVVMQHLGCQESAVMLANALYCFPRTPPSVDTSNVP